MFALNLMNLLHRKLGTHRNYQTSLQRFEALRGYGLLPRGRENAGARLSDLQIANAILGFVPALSGSAGHVALGLSSLMPVGGQKASYCNAQSLGEAIAEIIGKSEAAQQIVSVTLSIIQKDHDENYFARILYTDQTDRKAAYFVSKHALTQHREGAETSFDSEIELSPLSRQVALGRDLLLEICRDVEVSRLLNLPLKTNWQEYENEEERKAFFKRLGASRHSRFMNLGVETQVAWPTEPHLLSFSGKKLVLFPKTKQNSHSISIDLNENRMTENEAMTLINRFLSMLSWCDNRHALLRGGWSGSHIPQPVPKRDLALVTFDHWDFRRSVPNNEELLRCLAYYREGLNAREAGLAAFEVLSFYKVVEVKYSTRGPVKRWVTDVFEEACSLVSERDLSSFDQDCGEQSVGDYVYRNCRVATAHAARDVPSDGDASPEIRRLKNAAPILQALARYFIETQFEFSNSYLSDTYNLS